MYHIFLINNGVDVGRKKARRGQRKCGTNPWAVDLIYVDRQRPPG